MENEGSILSRDFYDGNSDVGNTCNYGTNLFYSRLKFDMLTNALLSLYKVFGKIGGFFSPRFFKHACYV